MRLLLIAVVGLWLTVTAATPRDCDTECVYCGDDGEIIAHKPDGVPCNPQDVCGRHHCMCGNCTESAQFACKLDGIDRATVATVLTVAAGAMLVIVLGLLFAGGGEVAARRIRRRQSQL